MKIIEPSVPLKPCPFCGHEMELRSEWLITTSYQVACSYEACPVQFMSRTFEKSKDAEIACNTRANLNFYDDEAVG